MAFQYPAFVARLVLDPFGYFRSRGLKKYHSRSLLGNSDFAAILTKKEKKEKGLKEDNFIQQYWELRWIWFQSLFKEMKIKASLNLIHISLKDKNEIPCFDVN